MKMKLLDDDLLQCVCGCLGKLQIPADEYRELNDLMEEIAGERFQEWYVCPGCGRWFDPYTLELVGRTYGQMGVVRQVDDKRKYERPQKKAKSPFPFNLIEGIVEYGLNALNKAVGGFVTSEMNQIMRFIRKLRNRKSDTA